MLLWARARPSDRRPACPLFSSSERDPVREKHDHLREQGEQHGEEGRDDEEGKRGAGYDSNALAGERLYHEQVEADGWRDLRHFNYQDQKYPEPDLVVSCLEDKWQRDR